MPQNASVSFREKSTILGLSTRYRSVDLKIISNFCLPVLLHWMSARHSWNRRNIWRMKIKNSCKYVNLAGVHQSRNSPDWLNKLRIHFFITRFSETATEFLVTPFVSFQVWRWTTASFPVYLLLALSLVSSLLFANQSSNGLFRRRTEFKPRNPLSVWQLHNSHMAVKSWYAERTVLSQFKLTPDSSYSAQIPPRSVCPQHWFIDQKLTACSTHCYDFSFHLVDCRRRLQDASVAQIKLSESVHKLSADLTSIKLENQGFKIMLAHLKKTNPSAVNGSSNLVIVSSFLTPQFLSKSDKFIHFRLKKYFMWFTCLPHGNGSTTWICTKSNINRFMKEMNDLSVVTKPVVGSKQPAVTDPVCRTALLD